MINYHLKNLSKYHGKSLCRSNCTLRHIKKGTEKEKLNLKAFIMVDPVTLWFEITQYIYKRAISIAYLVEKTWLSGYPKQMEILYDQVPEFIRH